MITVRNNRVTVTRRYLCNEPGWWYEVTAPSGAPIASGWCVGRGPRAKSQAMRDALDALNRLGMTEAA